jgi:hypothetical protein
MINYIKYIFLVILFSVSAGALAQQSEISKYREQTDSVEMRITLSTLASDEFEGRGTAQQGGAIAQEYIAAYLDSCGVVPYNFKSFFQNINSFKRFNAAKKRFLLNGVDFLNEYRYENLYHQDTVLRIKEIIFVVQGSDTDIKSVNVENKVVMMLKNTKYDLVGGNPATVINIALDFTPVSLKRSENIFSVPPRGRYNMVEISERLADKLLQSTGKTLREIVDEAEKSGMSKIFTLKTSAEIHGNVRFKNLNVNNIAGIIEGSDLKNEYIILSAHHDHVGIIDDRVYNGADDNASGVTSVLETARVLAKAKREGNVLRRSVVILFPAAEEMGLVGSEYYVKNPLFPLADTKACINVDMVGRIDDRYKSTNGDYIYMVNDVKTVGNLFDYVKKANSDNIIINTDDLNSLFQRSDHYSFAKNSIPAVLLTSGLHDDYHTPADDTELINFGAMWKRCRFIFSLVWNLANADEIKQPTNL